MRLFSVIQLKFRFWFFFRIIINKNTQTEVEIADEYWQNEAAEYLATITVNENELNEYMSIIIKINSYGGLWSLVKIE